METITARIVGISPLLMQAETLANPLHPLTKEHKAVAGKRKKTDDDYEWLLESEWSASMYHDKAIGPYVPAQNIEAALVGAGKIHRLGTTIKQAVQVLTDRAKLEYDGPRDKPKMWKSERFADVRGVNVSGRKVMRCRPIFLEWSAEFDIAYMEDVIDRADLIRTLEDAGRRVGIGTYRPRFGRFAVEVVK